MKLLTLVVCVLPTTALEATTATPTRSVIVNYVTVTFTQTQTTVAPYDSSAPNRDSSSAGDASGSLASDSLRTKDMSLSLGSLGSDQSGSSGFYMGIWLWCIVGALFCLGLAACASKKKTTKKTVKKKAAAPAEKPVELQPLMELAPLMPAAPVSQLIPSYSMIAAPQYAQMAAPVVEIDRVNAFGQVVERDFVAAAPTQYVAAPQYSYASVPQAAPLMYPGTVSYAAPGTVV